MDKPRKHYARLKKPVTKGHAQYGPIYMKCPNMQIYRDKKWTGGYLGLA